jgi:branched-chain amino acid transport system substrate-binding protein
MKKVTKEEKIKQPKAGEQTRRQFLKTAGAAGVVTLAGGVKMYLNPRTTHAAVKPIIIGEQADLTGPVSDFGTWSHRTAIKTIEKINKEGGICGRPVKHIYEDVQSDTIVSVRKLKKLVLKGNADFIIGAYGPGSVPSLPFARDYKTIMWAMDMVSEMTAEDGNRYIFRLITHVKEQVQSSVRWAMESIGKRWNIIVHDIFWGHSMRDTWTKRVTEEGGEIISTLTVPFGVKDWIPYIKKIDFEADGLFLGVLGYDTISLCQQLSDSGYNGKVYTVICTTEAMDLRQLGKVFEGGYILEYFPRKLKYADTPENRRLRKLIGINEEGRDVYNLRNVALCSHYWHTYELIYLMKRAMEAVGYKSKADTPDVIQWLESQKEFELSDLNPQGYKLWRGQDHQGFHQHWMSKVKDGNLDVQYKIPLEMTVYKPTVDYRLEKF